LHERFIIVLIKSLFRF